MEQQTHVLKTWPSSFVAVWHGTKLFELRRDDRGFRVGDLLDLHEWDPNTEVYTRRHVVAKVTCVVRHGEFPGIEEGFVVMGIRVLKRDTFTATCVHNLSA